MTDLRVAEDIPVLRMRPGSMWPAATALAGIAVAISVTHLMGSRSGLILLVGVVGLALGICAVASPVAATFLLLVAMFARLPVRLVVGLPIELFLIAFAALATSTILWMDRTTSRLRRIGAVEWAMGVYVAWNVYSMLAPHRYPAYNPLIAESFSVTRFIIVGIVIPFALYAVGRRTFDRTSTVRALLWVVLILAAYSAAVSILPFTPLSGLVWPRYMVEIENPGWAGRAVGILNHPVINGMILALGFAIAMLIASRRSEPVWQRRIAGLIALACGIGIYETHTRAAWLCGVLVLVIGAALANGYRRGYLTVLGLLITTVAVNWSTFTSSDREAGGVGSEAEVDARLNDIQTAFWAIVRKPLDGWGIGRFQSVNTYHHQQWSPEIAFDQGFGEVSHQNELAITAELGLIGLLMWLCILVLATYRLWEAYRALPADELCGKPIAVLAMMALAILVCAGLTVDHRFFEFPVGVIFLLVGITVGWADRTAGGDGVPLGGRSRHA